MPCRPGGAWHGVLQTKSTMQRRLLNQELLWGRCRDGGEPKQLLYPKLILFFVGNSGIIPISRQVLHATSKYMGELSLFGRLWRHKLEIIQL